MPKVTMPQLGESVAEGTIGKWLKQVGDHVGKYEPIVEVITDKVNAEVPSPFEGTLTQILVEEGATVPNNAEIAVIEAAGEAAAASDGAGPGPGVSEEGVAGGVVGAQAVADETGQSRPPTETGGLQDRSIFGGGGAGPGGSDERPDRGGDGAGAAPSGPANVPAPPQIAPQLTPPAVAPQPATAATSVVTPSGGSGNGASGAGAPAAYEGRMTPAVRRLAREHGVDLALIKGSGHAGRVTREDVMAFVEQQRTAPQTAGPASAGAEAPPASGPAAAAPAPAAAPAASGAPAAAPAPVATTAVPGQDELKPMTPMRKAIAAHMVRAKQTAPHAYTTVEVDMSAVVALRESLKTQYQAREGVSLSYVPFVTKAVVEALRRHPDLNAHWTDEGLLRKRDVNVGIAVAVEDGLIVPVIRNADQLSINGLNHRIQDMAARARANRLKLEDIQGGTFTVNNTGWFGSVVSQPIVNVPEVAILSMEAIVKRPVVIESPAGDSIAIRPMMNLCVSFDHRATDGAQIGRFVQDVRQWLQSANGQTSIW